MRILVVEDFKPLRESIAQTLREESYAVDEAGDGRVALWHIQNGGVDVVVLDLMLPEVDGLQVLQSLVRRKDRPTVLILTAKDTLEDRIRCLDAGADDYLIKPFSLAELLARVRALIRRRYNAGSNLVTVGNLTVDLNARRVFCDKNEIALSAREYAILEYLLLRRGQIVSRTQIWEHIYDENATLESNVVDVYIGLIRKKLESAGSSRLIHTRRGQGYLFSRCS